MKNKLGKITMTVACVSMALFATSCSSNDSSVTGGDTEEYSEVVESSSDEEVEVSSSSEKKEKVEKPSEKETPSSDSKEEASSDSKEKNKQAESSSSEKNKEKSSDSKEEKSEPVETSSSSEESLNTEEAESSSSEETDAYVDCSERPFPDDLMFLAGRGENDGPRFMGCDNDTILVHWQIRHTTEEHVVPAPETYVLLRDEYDWSADSLERFSYDYLDKHGFKKSNDYDYVIDDDIVRSLRFWWGLNCLDENINCDASELKGAKLHNDRNWKNADDVQYWMDAFPSVEISVDENGTRTIRYGFTMNLEVYYWAEDREKHLNKDSNKEG